MSPITTCRHVPGASERRTIALGALCVAFLHMSPVAAQPISSDTLDIISALHPLTGDKLPVGIPYPYIKASDGTRDRFHYIVRLDNDDWQPPPGSSSPRQRNGLKLSVILTDSETGTRATGHELEQEDNFVNHGDHSFWRLEGDIRLPWEILEYRELDYKAIIDFPDGRVAAFETEVTVGNPVLTMNSTLISNNGVSQGVQVTSTVEGRIPLAFPSRSYQAVGVGPLTYLEFKAEDPTPGCRFTTSTHDGSFRVLSVTFPEPFPVDSVVIDSAVGLPPPDEVLMFVDRGIRESLTISCPTGTVPLPLLVHWFAWFYSFHGGKLDGENEANPDRGGFEIRNWQPGEGNVIARKEYDRTRQAENAWFTERTTLVLKWP